MTHAEWLEKYSRMRAIAERIDQMRTQRGWALAATVGIGRCGCSLHNASISEIGEAWGAGPNGQRRIKVARAATRILNSAFAGYRIVERWDRRVRSY